MHLAVLTDLAFRIWDEIGSDAYALFDKRIMSNQCAFYFTVFFVLTNNIFKGVKYVTSVELSDCVSYRIALHQVASFCIAPYLTMDRQQLVGFQKMPSWTL
uniref:Uncharacterized protein n=1 Tax=Caenorhabditis japonica TaxID=281687 RepID=A0A8R1ITK1_CAEJA